MARHRHTETGAYSVEDGRFQALALFGAWQGDGPETERGIGRNAQLPAPGKDLEPTRGALR